MSVSKLPLREIEVQAGEPRVRMLRTISAASFAGQPVPKTEWVVENTIPRRHVTLLAADGGIGKSLLAMGLGAAVAGGFDWIGTRPIVGPVLYFSAEEEEDEHHQRLDDVIRSRARSFQEFSNLHIAPYAGEDAVFVVSDKACVLAVTDLWRGFVQRIEEVRPVLTVIDTRADTFGGEALSRTEVRAFIGKLRGLAITYNMAVLLIDHPSMSGLNSGTGKADSVAWHNSVRSRLFLDWVKVDGDRDPELRVLKIMKQNHGVPGGEFKLRWKAGTFELDNHDLSGSKTAAADANAEQIFLRLLARLTEQGRNVSHKYSSAYAPTVFAKEPDNGGVRKQGFERAMSALFTSQSIKVETSGSPSRTRNRIVKT